MVAAFLAGEMPATIPTMTENISPPRTNSALIMVDIPNMPNIIDAAKLNKIPIIPPINPIIAASHKNIISYLFVFGPKRFKYSDLFRLLKYTHEHCIGHSNSFSYFQNSLNSYKDDDALCH